MNTSSMVGRSLGVFLVSRIAFVPEAARYSPR